MVSQTNFKRVAVSFLGFGLVVAAVMSLLVGIESAVLWHQGVRFRPKHAIDWISLRDLSVSGKQVAGILCVRVRETCSPFTVELVSTDEQGNRRVVSVPNLFVPHRIAVSSANGLAISNCKGAIYLETANGMHLLEDTGVRELGSLAFSDCGKLLAAESRNSLFIWDVETGKRLSASSSMAGFLCFLPNSECIVQALPSRGGKSCFIVVRDVRANEIKATLSLDTAVVKAAVSPDGETVLLGCDCDQVAAWAPKENRILWRKEGNISPRRLALSNTHAAFFDASGFQIRICDSKNGSETTKQVTNLDPLHGMAFINDELHFWDSKATIRKISVALWGLLDSHKGNSVSKIEGQEIGSLAVLASLSTG